MRKSSAIFVSAIALGLAMFVPLKASAQGVTIYVNPGYPGYGAGYRLRLLSALSPLLWYGYPSYGYAYPSYGHTYPSYGYGGGYGGGYGYGRPYYGTYWGHNRRVARRVYRRWDRWD
jgi:hypothetical protein